MKKLFLITGLLGALCGSTHHAQAFEPFITLPAVYGAAFTSVGVMALGKLIHDMGRNPKATIGLGTAFTAGIGTGFATSAFIQWLIDTGCDIGTVAQNSGGCVAAASLLAFLGTWYGVKSHLPSYSKELKKLGSNVMHGGGYLALASGLLYLGYLNGY